MTIRNLYLVVAFLSFIAVTGCQISNSQPTSTSINQETSQREKPPEKEKETFVEDYKFKLNDESIESLKKGKILGFPVQLGDDEKRVKKFLGEPKKREDDGHGEITLTYPNYELYLTYYQGVGPDLKELEIPVFKAITFPIKMGKSEIEGVMGRPSDERAVRPGYPELMYDFNPYELLFITSKESSFEGPYDQLNLNDVRP